MDPRMTQGDLGVAKFIDHTALKPDMVRADLENLCSEAKAYGFFSVCIPPSLVPEAKILLEDSNVKVCTVVGFPLGYNDTSIKVAETKLALHSGADEIDMVININHIKDEKYDLVFSEVEQLAKLCREKILKVILETCLLTNDEIVRACQICKDAGADFVKTSTGFSSGGATEEAVKLMRETVGPDMGVKASGGIRNFEQAMAMINAGATRLGCSAGVEIVNGKTGTGNY